ncbi:MULTISPECIES: RNA polymerase sigma factor [Pandoraea]|uniref:RNA polymerase sigma 70 n=2 Tax=Pandoraea TaxID=93217 RepID=A0A5E4XKG1_9BURK|nr:MULTISPECIES: RNA polymerase sigma factor [Pandoraea]ALS58975.1 RNA polymerase subunit sigma-70 [Pandoraea norimbergensis]VVE36766.1 RNA polymerase sigma 70 [Pandoraea iniqua]VVE42662.1 RNA polymerase sigma 70 [Pandoraea iniqua]
MTGQDLPSMLPGLLPRLWAFALRIAGDRHDAEDLVQRACVHALERVHQWQPGTSALSWMYSIVHTTWINEIRSRRVRSRGSLAWEDADVETVPDLHAATPEDLASYHQVFGAVDQLPEAQRLVVLLVAVEGLSYQEAAQVLDVPIGTVMSRLSRARRTIGDRFRNPEGQPRRIDNTAGAREEDA